MATFNTSEKHLAFAKHYFHIVDEVRDSKEFAKLFNADGHFALGNFPTNVGHEAIAAGCQGMYNMCLKLQHHSSNIYSINDDTFIAQGTVTYTLLNGRVLDPIPLMSIYHMDPVTGLIAQYRAYIDVGPLIGGQGEPKN